VQPRLIATLSRMLRDVPLAEELTQDALVAALEAWPTIGVPDNPGAWLMTTARRRALDVLRRGKMLGEKHDMLAREMLREQAIVPDFDAALDDDIGDELLRLVFTACHPILSREARVALALRMICGLTTSEIARAYLVPEATISQRIVRAKRTLSGSGLAYETPSGEALSERLASVLEVVYLIFNEGYLAARGEEWLRPQLCDEALRMGRVLAGLAPDEPEVHGLVALMDLRADRRKRRSHSADGPGSRALGPLADPSGPARARTCPRARRCRTVLRDSGCDCGVSRHGGDACRYRLAAHRAALRRAGPVGALTDHRAQSRGRGRHGRGTAGRARPA
jgi:RNA polymerase sigma factor (sigma-70 family)